MTRGQRAGPQEPTPRTRVKRIPERGHYDRETIYRILDQGLVCHVGFVAHGQVFVVPMAYGRDEEHLLIHGSSASRMLRRLREGVDVCVTVTLLDGLVLSRTAFDHSMNYRSVVVLGRASPVGDRQAKLAALRTMAERVAPGRWDEVREPNEKELKATMVLSLPLDESSAKARAGPPRDDDEDLALPVWAGELPLRLVSLQPVADPRLRSGIPLSQSVARFRRERVPPIEDVAESDGPGPPDFG
jgi:nitroimidazol reductase NimA-like FMN-containing flavoprotein (pyridoxamine 5'-phosphate oxidase superfamily)